MDNKEKQSWIKHIDFILIDLFTLVLAFVCSYAAKFGDFDFTASGPWLVLLVTICLINLIVNLLINPYSGVFHRPFFDDLYRGFVLMLLNLAAASFLLYLMKMGANFSRSVLFWTYIAYYCVSSVLKYAWKHLVQSGRIRTRSPKPISLGLVSTQTDLDETMHNALTGDVVLYDIRCIWLIDGSEKRDFSGKIPILSSAEQFVSFVLQHNLDEVFISVKPGSIDNALYEKLLANGVRIHMNVESVVGFETEEQRVSQVGVYKALSLDSFSFSASQLTYLGLKRMLDILFGLVGCVLLVPISLLVKLTNLLSGDSAPIFYTQTRIGRQGKKFKMYKFRSMVPDADKILKQLLLQESYRREWEENQKFEQDPRITRAGRILRRTSVDELPQMINVLLGDMSLVGPRPLTEGELENHDGLKLYNKVKPGITGWWGCNGRSNIDYRERLDLEYYYVKNCSLHLDVICLLRTVLAVLKKDGAK